MDSQFDFDPWSYPVPVRRGGFRGAHRSHEVYDVEVDVARIGRYGFDARPADPADPGDLLWADLQTNPDANVGLRLGAGRSGFYRGAYVKGIGRTPLAGNWLDANDAYHNSGHMLPSAAIREHLITCYLRGQGLGATIVGCEAVLFRALPPQATAYMDALSPGLGRLPPIDRALQAITVKPGRFARFSNFLWALNHAMPSPEWVARFAHGVQRYLEGPATTTTLADCDPDAVAGALSEAIERAMAHFRAYFEAGVYWGSFHNNFTADGRFMDLELPTVFGAPFFGVVVPDDGRDVDDLPHTLWIGMDLLYYVRQARLFVAALTQRLAFIAEHCCTATAPHRGFLLELRDAIVRLIGPGHAVHDDAGMRGELVSLLTSTFDLTAADTGRAAELVAAQQALFFSGTPVRRLGLELRALGLRPADPEPGCGKLCLTARPFRLSEPDAYARGALFRDLITHVEQSRSVDDALERLAWAAGELTRAGAEAEVARAS